MRDRSRSRSSGPTVPLRSLTLILVVLVVVVTAGTPTAAVTSGSVTRGSSAAVADDANGLLGLDVAGSVSAGSSSRLLTVTNQLDRSLTVDVTSASSLSGTQATLTPGESLTTSTTVGCDSPPDTVTVTVVATAGSQFSGTATRSTTVDTSDCSSAAGPFSAVSGSATAGSFSGPGGGSTGSIAFTFENTETAARTVTAFEIVEAGTATRLSFGGPKPVNGEAGKDELYIDATGDSTDSEGAAEDGRRTTSFDVGDGTSHSLDQSVTIDTGEAAEIFLYQFQDNGTPYAFQSGDSITLTLTLQDGTQTTVTVTV